MAIAHTLFVPLTPLPSHPYWAVIEDVEPFLRKPDPPLNTPQLVHHTIAQFKVRFLRAKATLYFTLAGSNQARWLLCDPLVPRNGGAGECTPCVSTHRDEVHPSARKRLGTVP